MDSCAHVGSIRLRRGRRFVLLQRVKVALSWVLQYGEYI